MIYDLQRASMWKRISAFLFDGILLGIVAVLFCMILSVVLGYDAHHAKLEACYAKYEAEYGVDFSMPVSEFDSLSAEENAAVQAAYSALNGDEEAVYAYNMVMNLTILIATFGILFAFLALEFVVPLLFGNGQTLGKKIFGIALMRTEGIRVNAVSLFIRTVLGKYAIETMIPVLIIVMIYFNSIGVVGMLVLGGILLLEVIVTFFTYRRSTIHDLLATTVAVDLASQMIFATREDLIAYKQKVHAEKAAKQAY